MKTREECMGIGKKNLEKRKKRSESEVRVGRRGNKKEAKKREKDGDWI